MPPVRDSSMTCSISWFLKTYSSTHTNKPTGCSKCSSSKAAAIYHLLRGGWDDPNCAHRTSTVLSCAFCEHWDRPSYPAPFFSIRLRHDRLQDGHDPLLEPS